MRVNLSAIATAGDAARTAAEHYGALAIVADGAVQSLDDDSALKGGHGISGAYQAQFAEFGTEWLKVMRQFLDEERKLAAFLTGLSERFVGTQKLYQDSENRIAESFRGLRTVLEDGHA